MGRLEGKVCLITGAARGQGAEEAKLFAREGGLVWMVDVLDEQGEALAGEIGATYRHLDVTSERDWEAIVDEIRLTAGSLQVLVNNAGVFPLNRMVTTSVEEYQRTMDINALGVFLGMKTCAPPLIESGNGSIVNISSVAGMRASVGSFAYGASKWAVRGMTKTAAVELARKGVRVNSIHPGVIETPMVADVPNVDKVAGRAPLGRSADAAEVASLALYLASDESSYSTGAEFVVDGGLSAL